MNNISPIFFILTCHIFIASVAFSNIPKLLVISFDGFRYDYLNRNLTPVLNELKLQGISTQFILNIFPTQTFPNHFTIATGLYPEVHGVLGHPLFDAKENQLLDYGFTLFHYNKDVIPIWILNELGGGGRHSGVMMWPGGDFLYNGTLPIFREDYNSSISWKMRVDHVMTWFKDPKTPANLIMLYFEEPDSHGHAFGPDSPRTDDQIVRVNSITKYIVNQLATNNLTDVNIVILSDHGMEKVYKENIIDLTAVVGDISDMYGTSPVLQVFPKKGRTVDEVFFKLNETASKLKTFQVFRKNDVPERFHYKNCERSSPILVLAQSTYAFQDLLGSIEYYKLHYNISGEGPFGVHGYDPETVSMHPFFIAIGPAFKQGYNVRHQIDNTDLYQMFAHTLGLGLPRLRPNGTFIHVADLFSNKDQERAMLTSILGL